MRHLVTFILRVWVGIEAVPQTWEGQVECVATGERAHVRGETDMARFVESHLADAADQNLQSEAPSESPAKHIGEKQD
jgi:hypothetical protein